MSHFNEEEKKTAINFFKFRENNVALGAGILPRGRLAAFSLWEKTPSAETPPPYFFWASNQLISLTILSYRDIVNQRNGTLSFYY